MFPTWDADEGRELPPPPPQFKVPQSRSAQAYQPGAFTARTEAFRERDDDHESVAELGPKNHSFPETFDFGGGIGGSSSAHGRPRRPSPPKKPPPPLLRHVVLDARRPSAGADGAQTTPIRSHAERSFALLQSASKRHARHAFSEPERSSHGKVPITKAPVTPARPGGGPVRVSLASGGSSSSGSAKSSLRAPLLASALGKPRFAKIDSDQSTTPLRHAQHLLPPVPSQLDSTDIIAESPLVNRAVLRGRSPTLLLSRADSGEGFGPLAGPADRAERKRKDTSGDDEGTESAARALPLHETAEAPRTPSTKRQKALDPSSPGSVSLLKLGEELSPDRIGLRDKVVGRGLAERAASIVKKERSEWLMWEASLVIKDKAAPAGPHKKGVSIFAQPEAGAKSEGTSERHVQRRGPLPDRSLVVVQIVEPPHSAKAQHADQILALCRDARDQAQAQALVPALFSLSIANAGGPRSKRAAAPMLSGSDSVGRAMEALTALRRAPDQVQATRPIIDIFNPIEVDLGPSGSALLCTRFRLQSSA